MTNKILEKIKSVFEYVTDGSKGSVIDVIKVTIKITKEFILAVRTRLSQSVQKIDEQSDR